VIEHGYPVLMDFIFWDEILLWMHLVSSIIKCMVSNVKVFPPKQSSGFQFVTVTISNLEAFSSQTWKGDWTRIAWCAY